MSGGSWSDNGMLCRDEVTEKAVLTGMSAPGHAYEVWSTSEQAVRSVKDKIGEEQI